LRGQAIDGQCPECGLSIRNSAAAPDDLRFAPPRWLASICRGAALLVVAQILLASFLLFAGRPSLLWIRTVQAIETAAIVMIAAGAWLLTRPQRHFGPSGPLRRWVVRVLALCLVASSALGNVGSITGRMGYFPWAQWTGFVAISLLPLTLFGHLRRLSLRARNPRLAKQCRIVGVGFTASVLLSASVYLAAEHHWFRRSREVDASLLANAMGFVFYVWAMITLLRLTIAFRATWRDATALPRSFPLTAVPAKRVAIWRAPK
jgi:hypothetical protein